MAATGASNARQTLSVRAGQSLSLIVRARTLTLPHGEVDLESYSGRLIVRDGSRGGRPRVLIDATDGDGPNATLQRLTPGSWRLFLGKTYTAWLPPQSVLEVQVENKTNPEDVQSLFIATLQITSGP